MKVGIIGLGYWGPNLIRNFLSNPAVDSVIGCDTSIDRLYNIKQTFPSVEILRDYNRLLDSDIDAVAIATPVGTHYQIALDALLAGKHVWVEKPFTYRSTDAEQLIGLSKAKNLKLFVDHTFIYNGAIRAIKKIIAEGQLGEVLYFDSVRINLGLFQHDVNVIWDLVPHDLSIMNYILPGKTVESLTACGISNYYELENLAQVSLFFEDNSTFAHFHVNWSSPIKIRRIIIAGKKRMLVFDDMVNSEKIKIYDCGVDITSTVSLHNALVEYRIGDMYSPKVEQTEPLNCAVKEFIDCIVQNREPLTGGYDGLKVVRILEAADKSIKHRGEATRIYSDSEQVHTKRLS